MTSRNFQEEKPWMRPLMQSYYDGMPWSAAVIHHKVSDLISKPNAHGNYAIGKIQTKEKCSICNGEIYSYFPSKNEYQEGLKWAKSASCANCGHKPYNASCNCEVCKIKLRQQREQQKKEMREREAREKAAMSNLVRDHVNRHNLEAFSIEECTYDEWAILLAMLEQSTSENVFFITPINESLNPFSPSKNYTHSLIQEITNHLIFADECPISAYVEQDSLRWFGTKEPYLLRSETKNPKQYLLNKLKLCSLDCIDAEFITLDIKKLMLQEALTFLEQTRGEFNLPHKVGEKTLQTLNSLILNRPLGEVLYLIWKACNDAAASAQKAANNRSRASNLVIGNMERMHLRAKQNNWNLPCYKRFQFQEQNWMSYVYFNLVLELPGTGLEYSWLDVMKKQNLHNLFPFDGGPLAEHSPEAVEALKLLPTREKQVSTNS